MTIGIVLAMTFSMSAHAFVTVSGRVQYTRNWSNSQHYGGTGSVIPVSELTGIKPLQDVQVCFINSSTFQIYCSIAPVSGGNGYTSSTGDFTFSMTGGAGIYHLLIRLHGRNPTTTVDPSYKIVDRTSGNEEVLTTGTFTVPASGTFVVPTQTFTNCVPASASCPNDFANGHQMVQWAVARDRNTFGFSALTNFEAAVSHIAFYTDGMPNASCGTGSLLACCNFDYNDGDEATCWHEFGHALLESLINQNGTGQYGNYPPMVTCSGSNESGGNAVDEGMANLHALLMGYPIASAANLSDFIGFCYSTLQPIAEANNDCTVCEFPPNATQYINPDSCGTDPHRTTQRTECRVMKMLLDMVDVKAINGPACLSETGAVSYAALWDVATTRGGGTLEGQTHESATGESGSFGTVSQSGYAFSIFDILSALPLSNANKYAIWANGCYLPGDAASSQGNFLSGKTQVNPPF